MTPRRLGAVLAGGAGRRYGQPKGRVRLAGLGLTARAVATLRSVTDEVVVVSSRPVDGGDVRVVPDRVEGVGPLGGLHAALSDAAERGFDVVVLLGCDLPLITADVLARVAAALDGWMAAAPARRPQGVEALCSAWDVAALPQVAEALDGPDRSLHGVFERVGGRVLLSAEVGDPAPDVFLNVNTLDDARRAEALLAAREGG